MSKDSKIDVQGIITAILPEKKVRDTVLGFFREAVIEADNHGKDKWGVHCKRDRLRLLVGNLIVFTIHQGKIWLALDKKSLDKYKDKKDSLERCSDWQWDETDYPEYSAIPSKNGFYTPAGNSAEIWALLKEFHFPLIKATASKYRKLKKSSQPGHSPETLLYLREELRLPVPAPAYDATVNATPSDNFVSADELGEEEDKNFPEGGKQKITVNAYERNPRARQACIEHHGTTCCVCGFDFSAVYGDPGKGFIHVHHVIPLSDIGKKYEVDPIEDLRPVCPNCHAMIHKGGITYKIEDIKKMIQHHRQLTKDK